MIVVENLTKVFDKRGIAGLHSVSFSLGEGQIFALMGPNGSGKTTLLNLLSGEISPDKGSCKLSGSVSRFPRKEEEVSSKNVQKFLVESVTLDIDEEKKVQLARDLADTFEFTFQLRQNLNELSSGQKQKVLLSKELINRPALLLMDEPFTHLDPFTRKDILNGLFSYIRHQGTTVLWVTHDLEEAFRYSDTVGILNFGRFEQIATPEEMIRHPKNLFTAQFVGYRNFFPLKKEKDQWQSVWGAVPFPTTDKEHALLVVPDHAWSFDPEGPSIFIESRHAGKQFMEYEGKLVDQKIFIQQSPVLPVFELNTQVSLLPDFRLCFIIPL